MVVLRHPEDGSVRSAPYSPFLRPGGHVLVVGDLPRELARDHALERVRGTPFLRRKRGGPDGAAGGSEEQAVVRTLARRMLEEELVSRHLNLARGLARRFSGHGEPVEDLRQVAFVGLVLAARRYDPAQNASFSTYATATILGELKRYFRDKSWMMRVPRHVQETYLAIKTAREELYQELACSPTIGQIARRLRITEEAVLEAIEAGDNFLPQSLDSGPDEESPGREVPVVDPAFDVMLERNLLMDAIPRLSRREQLVLKRVYLDGWTQRKVAQEIGVSQMQVSRLLHASAHKIRAWTGN
jgi:RNA polymerase sigma-B factor